MRAAVASFAAMTCGLHPAGGRRVKSTGYPRRCRTRERVPEHLPSAVRPPKEPPVMSSTPAVGDLAPDFTLPGIEPGAPERDYSLSAERGHPVVLAFYPGDETPVCTRQLCSYQHDLDVLRDLDATPAG